MIKLCFFAANSTNFDPQSGGVQRITRVLSDELFKLGVKVYFLSLPNLDVEINYKKKEIVLPSSKIDSAENVTFLKQFLATQKIDIFINQDGFRPQTLNLLKQVQGLTKIISAHHNCVLCLYEKYIDIFKINRNATLTKVVTNLRLWGIVKYLFKVRQKFLWQKMLRLSDKVVVYFDSFIEELKALTGIESDKILAIANPAPFEILDKKKQLNKRLVYVGRIIKNQKRIDKLMELWKRLHNEFEEWRFDIVGSGNYLNEAKKYAKVNKLDRIKFHGMQDPLPFWDSADIFTLTSDFEGYGMVLIEAQARGTVPITFNYFSAIGDVVENQNSGIIINDFEIDSMYVEVKKLINDNILLSNMKQAGARQVGKFDKGEIVSKWYKMVKELCC